MSVERREKRLGGREKIEEREVGECKESGKEKRGGDRKWTPGADVS